MAAESSSLSLAVDRSLFLRLVLEAVLYSEPNISSEWRHHLKVPGVLGTDAKSLFDHLHKVGSLPTERSVYLDLLSTKELIEDGVVIVKWVCSSHMPADPLTKDILADTILDSIMSSQRYSLVLQGQDLTSELKRAELRRAQRQRRKERMRSTADV